MRHAFCKSIESSLSSTVDPESIVSCHNGSLLIAEGCINESDQKWTVRAEQSCETQRMTTKTIPEYLEDECQKRRADKIRIEEEAARIQVLHHGHHRLAKDGTEGLPIGVETKANTTKSSSGVAKKPRKTMARSHKAA